MHIFDSAPPISLDNYNHFFYCPLDIGRSCTFPEMNNPQEDVSATQDQNSQARSQKFLLGGSFKGNVDLFYCSQPVQDQSQSLYGVCIAHIHEGL